MKFTAFKEFKREYQSGGERSLTDRIISYLTVDMATTLRELQHGLTRLRFADNFDSFIVDVTVPTGGTDFAIRNRLRSGQIPTHRIILRGGSGSESVVDGDTDWTKDFVYLKNTGGSDVAVTVGFFR